MKTLNSNESKYIHKLLMKVAKRMAKLGFEGCKTIPNDLDDYDVLVTIRVKEKQNDSSQHI